MAGTQAAPDVTRALAPYVPRLVQRWPAGEEPWCRLDGSLVSADISGFTKLSERLAGSGKEGAEELTELINECFDGMISAAREAGGDVLKFGGDALLLLFMGPGHLERACQAAVAMRATIARPLRTRSVPRVKLEMSQGIHAGTFDFHLVDGGHLELIVTGPGVTATVECEAAAGAGEILLSAEAAAATPTKWLGGRKGNGRLLARTDEPVPYIPLPAGPVSDLTRFVPAAQREQITVDATGEHRRVAVAFVKFSDTDALALGDGPAAVNERLQRLAASVRAAVDRYDVHWLASDVYPDGGKVILTAGAPVSYGDDEDRAVCAARMVLDSDCGLVLRAGVNAGHVFVGNLGASSRRTFTVMGDAVNLAARLMQKAEPGQLVASRDTLARSDTPMVLEALTPFMVKGKSRPIEAAAVLSVGMPVPAGTAEGGDRLLFGREAERRILLEAVDGASTGAGSVVEIVADAGMGKSTLLAALRHDRPDTPVFAAAGGRYAQSTPYFAVRSLLRGVLGIAADTDRAAAGRLLAERVSSDAPSLVPWVPLLAVPVDATVESTPEVDAIAHDHRRRRLHEAVADLLGRMLPAPAVIAVEDGHWLDEASLELVRALAWEAARQPWAVVITRRPGRSVADPADHVALLGLEPIDRAAARALVAATAGDDLLPADVDKIVERAGGRPMFIAELARTAAARGVDSLPDSIESVVTTRIDTLPAAQRMLLRDASVFGALVDLDLAASTLGEAARGTEMWGALEDFLEPTGPRVLRFRHALYHEVAYGGLSYRRRRLLHARTGEAIEERAGGREDDEAALLSLHFHRAGAAEKAWHYSVAAGAEARAKYANVEAAEFYRRAVEAGGSVPGVGPDELRHVWEELGDVSELAARYDDAAGAYNQARRLSDPETPTGIRLLRKEGIVRERGGRYSQALRWYGRALRRSEALAPAARSRATADLALDYAGVRYRQGRHADCVRWARRALAEAEELGDRRTEAHAAYLLDIALNALGDPEAVHWRGRAVPIYEDVGDLVGLANALNNTGVAAYYEGRWDDALDHYRRSEDARQRSGDVVGAATQANNIAEILCDQGHYDEASALLGEALATWRAARYPVGVAVATGNLGRVEARAGELERAATMLKDALERFTVLGARSFVLETRIRQVERHLLAGEAGPGLDQAAAVKDALARGEGEEIQTVVIGRLLGYALLRVGRKDEGVASLRDSITRGQRLSARYEVALTRLALAETLPDADAEAERVTAGRILDELGVVRVPEIP